ncbi:prepilin-type N-terminal cleavage/methylation domain-containing protein [Candidatus Saccharibacteria bacterium]|nr:prepilin-type N-terminal cleavage/methylation domain-containing protein [Candidatus Saccharibacteria bacterium]
MPKGLTAYAYVIISDMKSCKNQPKYIQGFTIVELLIVTVVIAILASITVVAYNGIQGRAIDSRRLSDVRMITKALQVYKISNGVYPSVGITGAGSLSGWESSAHEAPGQFIRPLLNSEYGLQGGVPVDPVNSIATTNTYLYYRYAAGSNGCDVARGAYYVLGIKRTSAAGAGVHPNSPGFSCTRNWQTEFSWVTGGYER